MCRRHSPLHHYCYWNKWVANPIKKFGYVGKGRLAMRLLRTQILEHILLRRTKVQCADVLALPPRFVTDLNFPGHRLLTAKRIRFHPQRMLHILRDQAIAAGVTTMPSDCDCRTWEVVCLLQNQMQST